MDTFALVATVVLLAFIAWIVARNLGKRQAGRRNTGAEAGTGAAWSDGGGSRRHDVDHDGGGDAGADGGGGGD